MVIQRVCNTNVTQVHTSATNRAKRATIPWN